LTHELEQFKDYVVVVHKTFSFLLVDQMVSLVDAVKHSDNLVFDFAFNVWRLFSGDGEGYVKRVFDVFCQL